MASPSTKVCFNSNCKEVLGRSRKGWRRRTGEFAELCERCAAAYEEGKFCETFHLSTSGWRCCESCGKQIHCGCIVSFHMFVLLDAGGIECITCARTSFILTPNPAWPPPMLSLPIHHERIIDTSSRKWSPLAGSGPAPWRQSPNLFKESNVQSDMQPKVPFEVKIPSSVDELFMNNRLSGSSLEWKEAENPFGRLKDDSLKVGAPDILENGSAGIKCKEQLNPCVNVSQKPIFLKTDHSSPTVSLHPTSALNGETNDHTKVAGTSPLLTIPAPPAGKRLCNHIGFGSYEEPQICNVKAVGEARGRNQLLPRYWPKLTEQELKQIYGDSNCVITPLFEKMLSASDAGRIGRLVLPKKCAEAYFPPISNPEGMPLRVHDSKGKEWIFQFRFWLNNNSRMYVLEGVTSCIQSLQLQAGDIVTFGRAGSDGKLVMGCRKASVAPSRDQGNKAVDTSNMVTTHGDATRNSKPSEFVSTCPPVKSSILSPDILSVRANSADGVSIFSEVDKSGHPPLELHGQKASHSKRKKLTLGPKAKGLKKETDNGLEQLQLTWTEAQGLLRPPPNVVPSLVVVEGMEIEEYEDAPIIGRPTIFAKDHGSIQIQWAQCEDCFKWRKVPADALLPPTWTCSGNSWDPERSICSAAQELTSEQLEDLLSTGTNAACKKMKANKKQNTNSSEAVEKGLLSSSSQVNTTTKHPLYRINEAAASPLNEAFKVKFDLNIQPVE